jgi:hypothetical protein
LITARRAADLDGEATLGRTSSALTEQGDLRAASITGLRPTLPMSELWDLVSSGHSVAPV